MKIAGAPISWGVCEVPGWGHQLTPERVLAEMRDVGMVATELGRRVPAVDPEQAHRVVGLLRPAAVWASSRPLCCTTKDHDPLPDIAAALDALLACRANVLVLAAATGVDGYDARPMLDERGSGQRCCPIWTGSPAPRLTAACSPYCTRTSARWWRARSEVQRVLDGSAIRLCLDTGHLLIGGTDPLQLRDEVPDRIAHAHLKDVDTKLAARCASRQADVHRGRRGAVCTRRWAPVTSTSPASSPRCASNGYDGWFVMEQDTILDGEPTDEGPLRDVRASVAFMQDVCRSVTV